MDLKSGTWIALKISYQKCQVSDVIIFSSAVTWPFNGPNKVYGHRLSVSLRICRKRPDPQHLCSSLVTLLFIISNASYLPPLIHPKLSYFVSGVFYYTVEFLPIPIFFPHDIFHYRLWYIL